MATGNTSVPDSSQMGSDSFKVESGSQNNATSRSNQFNGSNFHGNVQFLMVVKDDLEKITSAGATFNWEGYLSKKVGETEGKNGA